MDDTTGLTEMDPIPIRPSPDHRAQRSPSPHPPRAGHEGIAQQGIPQEDMAVAVRPIPGAYGADDLGSTADYGRPVPQLMLPRPPPQQTFAPPPPSQAPGPYMQQYEAPDMRTLRLSCQFNLREYLSLQRKLDRFDASMSAADLDLRLRAQTGLLLSDLAHLQTEVRNLGKAAQNHRWRKWLVGGILASFIPLVRRIFRRGDDEESQAASNDTEYAFRRTRRLLARIRDILFGRSGYASLAFFVFAVLYIFQNEVTLRVARTLHKRIKLLSDGIQDGDRALEERDMRVLEGWRWRVLLW